jgi:cyanophycinase-like exopeptidase
MNPTSGGIALRRCKRKHLAQLARALALTFILAGTALSQGSLLLVGGGSEDYNDWSDTPYRWLVTHAPNRKILVLNYADTTDFFSSYFPWLSPCTVSNLAITSVAQANDSIVYRRILEHDGIFLRGGDQWQYLNRWRRTLTEQAIREVYQRGGVVGGTSAGEMVLTGVVFDARLSSVQPRDALRNPLGASITLTDDFLNFLPETISDSHFFERGRLGRLPAFLALYAQSKGREIVGIGAEYGTALAIGPDGIGEAMGSGTVTILRYSPATQSLLEAGAPLSMRNLRFDQLTEGERFDFSTGEPLPSGSATPYASAPFVAPPGTIILDGSEWSGSSVSLTKLQEALGSPHDTVCILSPLSAQSTSVAAALYSLGIESRIVTLGASTKNDPATGGLIASSGGFVFLGNTADSIGRWLDTTTVAGRAFAAQVPQGKPIALLGDDAAQAGEEGVGQMYRSIYGAYYGYLTHVVGLRVLKGMQCVARLYEQSDYVDNRASSVFWAMAERHLPFGLLLDQGTTVTLSGSQLRVYGSTPAMLIDARAATWASVPAFHDPGKANPRQLGGILGATLHVLRDGEMIDLAGTSSVDKGHAPGESPAGFSLEQNYPNPFNPITTIEYTIAGARDRGLGVSVRIYDPLGREVAVLVDGKKDPGRYTVTWDANMCASGVYIIRMVAGDFAASRKIVLVK